MLHESKSFPNPPAYRIARDRRTAAPRDRDRQPAWSPIIAFYHAGHQWMKMAPFSVPENVVDQRFSTQSLRSSQAVTPARAGLFTAMKKHQYP